ncbi:MAG: YheU family protein [Pseudomonadota bacterium]
MIIPHTALNPDTLRALVEEFVTRDGTDYGESEIPLERKVEQVIAQLARGEAFIVYSELHETCTIMSRRELAPQTQREE